MYKLVVLSLISVIFTACIIENDAQIPIETGNIDIFFCPRDNCEQRLIFALKQAQESILCAFYDLDLLNLINELNLLSNKIDLKLVIDSDNYIKLNIPTVFDKQPSLMHNKFCVIDNKKIVTGSFNPTENGNTKNNNNILIIKSKYLVDNYKAEFYELWNKQFGFGQNSPYPSVIINNQKIENYFCPEDNCKNKIIEKISQANKSIYFMTFTFTDEDIADSILVSKVKNIQGIMEKFQAGSKYSQFNRLKEFGLDISLDNNSAMMHHKVFILDNLTVITGSFNPTNAANTKNDENILIINDKNIAKKYMKEFTRLKVTKSIKI